MLLRLSGNLPTGHHTDLRYLTSKTQRSGHATGLCTEDLLDSVMPSVPFLDHIPLPLFLLLATASLALAIEGGFRFGVARLRRAAHEKDAPVGAVVAATQEAISKIPCRRGSASYESTFSPEDDAIS